jgi:hypothetical protein
VADALHAKDQVAFDVNRSAQHATFPVAINTLDIRHQTAREIRSKLVAEHPDDAGYRRDLAENCRKVGGLERNPGT